MIILTIGWTKFECVNTQQAATIMDILADCKALTSDYEDGESFNHYCKAPDMTITKEDRKVWESKAAWLLERPIKEQAEVENEPSSL